MKRDMDLIRKMVLAIEDAPTGFVPHGFTVDGHTHEEIGYHAYLLVEAGLAEGNKTSNTECPSPQAILTRLTWNGHEFADASRDEGRWSKAKALVKEKAGSVTLAVLSQLLTGLMKAAVGL